MQNISTLKLKTEFTTQILLLVSSPFRWLVHRQGRHTLILRPVDSDGTFTVYVWNSRRLDAGKCKLAFYYCS